MKTKVLLTLQVIVGLALMVFGANNILHFMPNPPSSQEFGMFMGALAKAGYVMPIAGGIEFLAGLAFVTNRYVALMSVIVMPIILNAVLAHLFIDPSGILASAVILFFIIAIMFKHKATYAPIFKAN